MSVLFDFNERLKFLILQLGGALDGAKQLGIQYGEKLDPLRKKIEQALQAAMLLSEIPQQIEPCPVCGSAPKCTFFCEEWSVSCDNPECLHSVMQRGDKWQTADDVADSWNKTVLRWRRG